MTPLVAASALLGLGVGLAADRLAARWPVHEDGGVRRPDWRTAALVVGGAAAFAALAARRGEPGPPAGPGAPLLLVLLALDPWLAGKEMPLASALLAGFGAPAILFVLDRLLRGALGAGDLKLAVGLGLMSGVTRLFGGLVAAPIPPAGAPP